MKTTVIPLLTLACLGSVASRGDEPVIGGPCEGCENVFIGQPEEVAASARIAPDGEPGEPMVIEGTVLDADGKPAPGIVVYAYHTNAEGVYPRGETWHGRLRGWASSDAEGHFRFDTIRPGPYPEQNIPQHVHMHVIEPGKATYTIDDLIFDDDPHLTPRHLRQMQRGRGGPGLVRPTKDDDGVWRVRRDITLGRHIEDYPP